MAAWLLASAIGPYLIYSIATRTERVEPIADLEAASQ